MKFLYLIFMVLCAINPVLAEEKTDKTETIKFHQPQTDAEKALDRILRVEDRLEGTKINKYEDITTKAFRDDEYRKQVEYEKSFGCNSKIDLCDFMEANHITGSQDILTDIGFLYHTALCHVEPCLIFVIPLGYKNQPKYYYNGMTEFKKDFIQDSFRKYYMKKENGTWKVNGICCGYKCYNSINIGRK